MLNIKKITAGIVTALLLVGMLGTTAMATESTPTTPIGETTQAFTITKNLIKDKNVEEYPEFTFEFNVDAITTKQARDDIMNYFGAAKLEQNSAEISGASKTNTLEELIVINEGTVTVPALSAVEIPFTGKETATNDPTNENRNIVSATGQISFDGKTFPKAGLYLYKITEKKLESKPTEDGWLNIAKSDTDELISQSNETYILVVSVINGDAGLEVSENDSFILHSKTVDGETSYEKSDAVFENVYQRGSDREEDPNDYDLKIQKTVTGKYGDKTKEFSFNITLNQNATEELRENGAKTTYKAQKYDANDKEVGEELTLQVAPVSNSFTLKDGEYILLKDFPVGSSYKLEEAEDSRTGYQTTVNVKENGTETANVAYDTFASTAYLIGESENSANVTNNADLVLTGIVTDNLSFILLIVVAVAGMTAYVVLKRRLRNR